MDQSAGKTDDPHSPDRLLKVTGADIVSKACIAAFGKPLVLNSFRSMLVEAMVAEALAPDWRWVSGDWAGWDFESGDGTKLEVKQSAARQTWAKEFAAPSKCVFDIAPRTGHWVGDVWTKGHRRYADIYIFAHHPVHDSSADQRDPHQWRFFVTSEITALPANQRTMSLASIEKRVGWVGFVGLARRTEVVRAGLAGERATT